MTNSCNVLAYRVKKIQHHYGQPPEAIPSLPAFVAAYHVLTGTLGIDTVTKAAIATGVPRPAIDNALVVLQADNPLLVRLVLAGCESLHHAAKSVRPQIKLIQAFAAASPDDCVALDKAIGPEVVFDRVVVAAL